MVGNALLPYPADESKLRAGEGIQPIAFSSLAFNRSPIRHEFPYSLPQTIEPHSLSLTSFSFPATFRAAESSSSLDSRGTTMDEPLSLRDGRKAKLSEHVTASSPSSPTKPGEPVAERSWQHLSTLIDMVKGPSTSLRNEAWNEIVHRTQGAVYSFGLKILKDPLKAEELAQDVFIHAVKKIEQLRDPKCFMGWLRQMAHRMAFNKISRNKSATGGEAAEALLQNVPAKERENAMVSSERAAAVRSGLASLKTDDREVLELFYLNSKSLKEIAATLEVPIGTVKRRLHVARRRLSEKLSPELSEAS